MLAVNVDSVKVAECAGQSRRASSALRRNTDPLHTPYAQPHQGLAAAAEARHRRGEAAPAELGSSRDAPPVAPGAQSVADGSSLAWDLCGAVREHARRQLEIAASEGLNCAGEPFCAVLRDVDMVKRLCAYICACESVLASRSYVSVGTYLSDVRRLMVAFRCNASVIMTTMDATTAATARSARLLRGAPRTASLVQDDKDRAQFNHAFEAAESWFAADGTSERAADLQCPNCFNTDNVSFRARQDRSGDEGMTYYIVCRNCQTITKAGN